jgi:hypothetical protein
MTTYKGVQVKFHSFLTSVLGEWSASLHLKNSRNIATRNRLSARQTTLLLRTVRIFCGCAGGTARSSRYARTVRRLPRFLLQRHSHQISSLYKRGLKQNSATQPPPPQHDMKHCRLLPKTDTVHLTIPEIAILLLWDTNGHLHHHRIPLHEIMGIQP